MIIPLCLVGTAQIHFGLTLVTLNLVLGLKDTFKGRQAAHFAVICTSFGPNFQAVQPVLASFLGQFSFAKYNSQFVSRGSLFTTYRSEHIRVIVVHHSIVTVTEHLSRVIAHVVARKAQAHKIQQQTHSYEQSSPAITLTRSH